MIVGGNEFQILRPFDTKWGLNVTRKLLTTGFYRTWSNDYSTDSVSCVVTCRSDYATIISLKEYLYANSQAANFTFNKGEKIFGSHVDYSNPITCKTSLISGSDRSNFKQYQTSFLLTTSNLSLDSSVVPDLDDLWFPSSYSAGTKSLNEVTTFDTYGNSHTSSSGIVATCRMVLSLDEERSAKTIRSFVELIRGDHFVLPVDFASTNPFGEYTYTHAQLLGLSFSQSSFNNYAINLELQGYDNG